MPTKEWTLMFYFASDNPLASTIVSQLKAIKDAGYHPDANVIAHFDPHTPNTPVHVFDVNQVEKFWYPNQSKVGFTANNPFVRDLVLDRLWGENHDDIRTMVADHVARPEWNLGAFEPPKPSEAMSGEQNSDVALESFLAFCRDKYPARHYMLFILGHGQVVGNDTLLLDYHSEKKSLTLRELGRILRSFNREVHKAEEPGQVELVTLHSCSMSAVEVAYELKGAANYLLASQGPAYVGNLPYKQILIRVFNDLNLELSPEDINGVHQGKDGKQSFVEKLFKAAEPVSQFLRKQLSHDTAKGLEGYTPGTPPDPKLVTQIVNEFNDVPNDRDADNFLRSISRNGNGASHDNDGQRWDAGNRRRFFRLLLADKYPEIARYPRHSIDTMLGKIFYYCLYNSYDFQLAGYPYDLCLANLTKVLETRDPINRLADSLIAGLNDGNPAPKQLILLAHWDAQSFYQEDYVDLYDFCYCLMKRCEERQQDSHEVQVLQEIHQACQNMRAVLEKDPEKLIALSAFSGAAFQYSHGLSIYFPWTRPVGGTMWDKEYAEYRLNTKTRWREFLNIYFEKTMRKTRDAEMRADGFTPRQGDDVPVTKKILALIGQIGAHVFVGEGALQKPGPDHPMGKYGPDDPTGANCDCPTIKNYPSFTGEVQANGHEVKVHVSDDFFRGVPMTMEPTSE